MINYAKLDHKNKRIIMDRTFARNADIVGSPEYNQLQDCRKDYPNYKVVRREIRRNPNQERYKGLTYRYMEDYIITHEPRETVKAVLDEFYEMMLISKAHSKPFRYPTIKAWFFERYPEFIEFGMKPAVDHQVKVFGGHDGAVASEIKKGA